MLLLNVLDAMDSNQLGQKSVSMIVVYVVVKMSALIATTTKMEVSTKFELLKAVSYLTLENSIKFHLRMQWKDRMGSYNFLVIRINALVLDTFCL